MFKKISGFTRFLLFKFKTIKLRKNIRFNQNILLPLSLNFEIDHGSRMEFGKVLFNKNVSIRVRNKAKLLIGNGVNFNNGCILTCRNNIEIGNNVLFGPNVMIFDHDHDYMSEDYARNFKLGSIKIEDNVWIGANVVILKDTIIKKNTVIAAGTVVKGLIEENSIVYNKQEIIKKPIIGRNF